MNGFKISDIDQLILALIFRFGVILVNKIGCKVSCLPLVLAARVLSLPGVLAPLVEASRRGTFVVESTIGKEYFILVHAVNYYVLCKKRQDDQCSISFKNSRQNLKIYSKIL